MKRLEDTIIDMIKAKGPLTGAELLENISEDSLIIWRTCRTSSRLNMKNLGTRYLRLDRRIHGFARLSPSILREFLTYTVVGQTGEEVSLDNRVREILSRTEEISRAKSELAYLIVSSLGSRLENELPIYEKICFILAGDIVYNMAHDVPRPERSTKKLVRGSDIDLVVIVDDDFSEKAVERLDNVIYEEKYRLLITPHIREELDYVVKDLNKVKEQLDFKTFKHMVACKILHEGVHIYGSNKLFERTKSMLKNCGVVRQLQDMESKAQSFRKWAEEYLLKEDPAKLKEEYMNLFYPTEESEEFE